MMLIPLQSTCTGRKDFTTLFSLSVTFVLKFAGPLSHLFYVKSGTHCHQQTRHTWMSHFKTQQKISQTHLRLNCVRWQAIWPKILGLTPHCQTLYVANQSLTLKANSSYSLVFLDTYSMFTICRTRVYFDGNAGCFVRPSRGVVRWKSRRFCSAIGHFVSKLFENFIRHAVFGGVFTGSTRFLVGPK